MPGRLVTIQSHTPYRVFFSEYSRLGSQYTRLGTELRLSNQALFHDKSITLIVETEELSSVWPGSLSWEKLSRKLMQHSAEIYHCKLIVRYQTPRTVQLGDANMLLSLTSFLNGKISRREASWCLDLHH